MTKKYLLAGLLIFSVLLSACDRIYQGADVAVTPSPAGPFVGNPAQTMAALQTEGAAQGGGKVTNLELTEGAATNGTAITPVTQVTFTATPMIGGSNVTVTATTPAPSVTTQPQPVATTAVAPPTTVVGRPATYILQPGEFPYCIARRFNVDPDQLLSLSGLSAGVIYPAGTVLKIPQSGSFPGERALRAHPATYTVTSADENIYSIACLFGDVTPEAIAQANGLAVSAAALPVGKVLNIP